MSDLAKRLSGQVQPGVKLYKKGGAVKHDDAKEDAAMLKKMVKKEALTGKKKGGCCGK